MKANLYNYTLKDMEEFFLSLKEKKYRAKQVFKWLYCKKASAFQEMSDLPISLREKLKENTILAIPKIIEKNISGVSPTIKYLHLLEDNKYIETVFIPKGTRTTICISSQSGCALACDFCATGKMGFKRNLSTGEIVGQILSVIKDTGKVITNIVVMGMGEPFLNYEQVIKAVAIISDENGLAIAPRRITISTIGIIPMIKRFTDEGIKAKLAISLNATEDRLRNTLMPGIKKYPIRDLIDSIHYYTKKTHKRVTFEYVLLSGINDSIETAETLAKLLLNIKCKINLIPFNSTGNKYERPSNETIDSFFRTLRKFDIQVNIRWSDGEDINAACGQLLYKNER